WFSEERTVQSAYKVPGANPTVGFGAACNNWDQRTVRIADTSPDHELRLWGDPIGANTSTPTNTPAPTNTPGCGGATWIQGNPFPSTGTGIVRALGVWFPANGKFYSMRGRTSDAAASDIMNPWALTPGRNGTGA